LTLCYWAWATVPQFGLEALPAVTSQPSWHTRDQFVDRYAEQTGRDLTHIGYYEVLGIYKLAVILQQIYYRFRRGQTNDGRFQHFDKRVHSLVELASSIAGKIS
jgi:aminoglycoside phosphotransferase (APT) family kinase protein